MQYMTPAAAEAAVPAQPLIVVGALTRRRPDLFSRLLASLERMDIPQGVRVAFCFAENDAGLTIGGMVEDFAEKRGLPATAVLETRPGIPFGRNAVLDAALGQGADHLAFVDDDEEVATDWLVKLYDYHLETGADLTGGPDFPIEPTEPLTAAQRMCFNGLSARCQRMAESNQRLELQGHGHKAPTVVTSNWLAKLEFLRETGLRFDEGLGLSGGSDTAFFRALRQAGGQTAWTAEAKVYEHIPLSRLSAGYQFRRGRDQSISSFRIRYGDKRGPKLIAKSAFFVLAKTILGTLRLIAAPFNGGSSYVLALRAFGFAYGRILALLGHHSRHYKTTHGG